MKDVLALAGLATLLVALAALVIVGPLVLGSMPGALRVVFSLGNTFVVAFIAALVWTLPPRPQHQPPARASGLFITGD